MKELRKARPSLVKKQEKLYALCHDYLIDNFHKFSEANKIKVATVLCGKLVPQKVETEVTFNRTPDIYLEGVKLEYNIGNRIAEHSEEAESASN